MSADLDRLRSALDEEVPSKALDRNLLIATWNVRAFGGLTEKWESAEGDSPKRDLLSLRSIAEIVSRFDVVAPQEAKDNLKALRHMMHVLGPNWGLSLTDVTEGSPGNGERLAFVFWRLQHRPQGRCALRGFRLYGAAHPGGPGRSPAHHLRRRGQPRDEQVLRPDRMVRGR